MGEAENRLFFHALHPAVVLALYLDARLGPTHCETFHATVKHMFLQPMVH